MTQITRTTDNAANLFTAANVALPTPVCVTAFIAPQSLIVQSPYAEATTTTAAIVSVGVYMSDRSIGRICNFTNAANALNYAFLLKTGANCPISKNAFALLTAEIKRTGAVSTRAQARANAKAEADAKAEDEAKNTPILETVSGSPLSKQYAEMKKKHPDAVILFRCGDFYETFAEDAQTASEVLGITLTTRANGKDRRIFLAGFPHHALDSYLPKLVRAGHRVAICEQLEEPKAKKTTRAKKATA